MEKKKKQNFWQNKENGLQASEYLILNRYDYYWEDDNHNYTKKQTCTWQLKERAQESKQQLHFGIRCFTSENILVSWDLT